MSSSPTLQSRLAAEFLGTFVFVLVGAGSAAGAYSAGAPPLLVAAFANGLGLAMAVSATMGISGGVLNPAVTLGLLIGRKLRARDALPYILVQVAGATSAAVILTAVVPSEVGVAVQWGAPSLHSISVAQGILLELVMTFVLVVAVYGTAVDPRGPKMGGLGIGLAVMADVLFGGTFTGAAMNPARAAGPMIAGGFIPSYWYIYWVGPIAGALLAGLAYAYLIEKS